MYIFVFIYLMLISVSGFCFQYPNVTFSFNSGSPSTVFYGETLRIPLQMNHYNLKGSKIWAVPQGSYLEVASGNCPSLGFDNWGYYNGTCLLNIVIPGNSLGAIISGSLNYHVYGSEGRINKHSWNYYFNTPSYYVTVIPHYLAMSIIPLQQATANLDFIYNLKSAVRYYDENFNAGKPAQGIVTPSEQEGLRFDQASFSIIGKPKRIGTYIFKVGATNANGTAEATDLKIEISPNPKDKPVFKNHYTMASAIPDQKYSMNLMELIEPQTGFGVINQISFRIEPNINNPEWLHILTNDFTRLEGEVPKDAAGKTVEIILIASSNTGGDSDRLTVKIPITVDSTIKPAMNYFEMNKEAGTQIKEDLSGYLTDPAHSPDLKVILEKVEPEAPWLNISFNSPTVLEGTIPDKATGQKFLITLRANTPMGGNSEPITVPLTININKEMTPGFRSVKPILPMLYPRQSYFYDFVENRDVYPEYDEEPYQINFAEGYDHPSWLRIENNKLIADLVPDDINFVTEINLVITNIPGGSSHVITLGLSGLD